MRLIIISNRLPVKVKTEKDKISFVRSEGGLATGLGSLEDSTERLWIGWPGVFVDNESDKEKIDSHLKSHQYYPVYLSGKQIEDYYEGYSNSTLWPLCHYFYSYIEYNNQYLQTYREVNQLFCEAALKIIRPGDQIWIQDYQLMLLPAMLRERIPDACIGYFHHIPFPSYELFRVLPERAEILMGLLGADLIGFHTHDYMRHFISAVYRVLDLNCQLDEIRLGGRVVHVDSFPMGINYDTYHDAILSPDVQKIANRLKGNLNGCRLILSVDRLDYSKGILMRLKGFDSLLEHHPEYRGKVSLAMVVVPSRDNVDIYAELKTKIDKMIGHINGAYSTTGWTAVYYFYRSLSFKELAATYNIADIALVTPLRDGMNLVAKEYLATKRDDPGILILSEMAGASIELSEAIIINPNDPKAIEDAILHALEMPKEEQTEHLKAMQEIISRQTISQWAEDFVSELDQIRKRNEELSNKRIGWKTFNEVKTAYSQASKRLIILDYDGTLVPFHKNPRKASPSPELLGILKQLISDGKNKLVISSGRDPQTLDLWLGDLPIGLAAEHGVFYKENGIWIENIQEHLWDDEVRQIVEKILEKTPRSKMEIKKTALVWHYRNVDIWLAELRVNQLISALIGPCARLNLQIMKGNKVIEIKSSDYNKGIEAQRLMQQDNYDFIMAIGDDVTDEDMFHALPPEAITIKVGEFSDSARYFIPTQPETVKFLYDLTRETVEN